MTNYLAITLLVSLAAYFVLESAQSAAPTRPGRRRDLFAAAATALIAALLIAMAGILLDPDLHGVPQPPQWLKREWLL